MIKGVIFDVGGVLLRTHDHSSRRKWESRLGLKPGELAFLVFDSEMGRQAQLGRATLEEVWAWVGTDLGLSDEQVIGLKQAFWSGDRLDQELCNYIRGLRPRYRTGMLSNNWAPDGRVMAQELGIADCFDVFVTSAELGVMKPDPRIYQVALDRLRISPSEGIFVDDSPENVEAARRLGMWAVHFTNPAQARDRLNEMLTSTSP
jgi:epoxide hydrolase-like predicted phosphatase